MRKTIAFILTGILLVVVGLSLSFSKEKHKHAQSSYIYDQHSDSLLIENLIEAAKKSNFRLKSIEPFSPNARNKSLNNTIDLFKLQIPDQRPTALYFKEKRPINPMELGALLLKNPQGNLYDSLIMDNAMLLLRADVSRYRKESWTLVNQTLAEFESNITRFAVADSFYLRSYAEIILSGKR